jgi:hypothetical protein
MLRRRADVDPQVYKRGDQMIAQSRLPGSHSMCPHQPACPPASARDHDAAHTVACHPEQGWSLLCNGVVVFEDTGEILPDGSVVGPCGRALAAPRAA